MSQIANNSIIPTTEDVISLLRYNDDKKNHLGPDPAIDEYVKKVNSGSIGRVIEAYIHSQWPGLKTNFYGQGPDFKYGFAGHPYPIEMKTKSVDSKSAYTLGRWGVGTIINTKGKANKLWQDRRTARPSLDNLPLSSTIHPFNLLGE